MGESKWMPRRIAVFRLKIIPADPKECSREINIKPFRRDLYKTSMEALHIRPLKDLCKCSAPKTCLRDTFLYKGDVC